MRRTHILLAGLAAGVASCSAVASAHGGIATAHAGRAATVELRHTRLGTILTSASGFTLYEFTRDRGAQDSCVKIRGCAAAWPALQSSGTPSAGPGVRASLLSSTRLSGGVEQVTYAGHPLYLFSGDSRPGATSYVGVSEFGGAWEAITASGEAVR